MESWDIMPVFTQVQKGLEEAFEEALVQLLSISRLSNQDVAPTLARGVALFIDVTFGNLRVKIVAEDDATRPPSFYPLLLGNLFGFGHVIRRMQIQQVLLRVFISRRQKCFRSVPDFEFWFLLV